MDLILISVLSSLSLVKTKIWFLLLQWPQLFENANQAPVFSLQLGTALFLQVFCVCDLYVHVPQLNKVSLSLTLYQL